MGTGLSLPYDQVPILQSSTSRAPGNLPARSIAGAGAIANAVSNLVTNDDGVRAPGLLAVAQVLKELGEVTVIAPAENQSAKGHSLTVEEPIYLNSVELPGGLLAMALAATPATCVKVALAALLPRKPDLVVSGINFGYNAGMVTYVSGTVAAAREAALQGIPAVASSLDRRGHPNYQAAAEATLRVARLVKANGLDRGVLLNVNVPAGAPGDLKGLRLTTQSAQSGTERYVEQKTPAGRRLFWNVYRDPRDDREGTDLWAIAQGYVAVTPLRVGEFDQKTFEAWRTVIR